MHTAVNIVDLPSWSRYSARPSGFRTGRPCRRAPSPAGEEVRESERGRGGTCGGWLADGEGQVGGRAGAPQELTASLVDGQPGKGTSVLQPRETESHRQNRSSEADSPRASRQELSLAHTLVSAPCHPEQRSHSQGFRRWLRDSSCPHLQLIRVPDSHEKGDAPEPFLLPLQAEQGSSGVGQPRANRAKSGANQGQICPPGHGAVSGGTFGCHTSGGRGSGYRHLVGGSQGCCSAP